MVSTLYQTQTGIGQEYKAITGGILTLPPRTNGNVHVASAKLESEVVNPDSLRFIGFINIPTEASTASRFGHDFYKAGIPSPAEGNALYVKLVEKEGKPLSALLYEGPEIKSIPKFHVKSKSRLYDILYRLKAKAKNLYVIK